VLAIPLATMLDVSIRDLDPTEAEVPLGALSRQGCGNLSTTWYPPIWFAVVCLS
jgi:hypothetical protein